MWSAPERYWRRASPLKSRMCCSRGRPASVKGHLAVALGVKAIKNGFSVQHYVLDDLMHVHKGDAAIPPRRLKAKRYLNSALLVIDEVGFLPSCTTSTSFTSTAEAIGSARSTGCSSSPRRRARPTSASLRADRAVL